jgi:hypothetical protein
MVASVEELVQVLQATLSPDVATREQAEAYLKQHDYAKGYIVGLMQVATAPQADGGIRQAAAIHLKNISAKGWEPKREESPRLHEEDKVTIRANILESFIQSPELIRSQLTEVMRVAVQHDFPERWPDLLTTLMGHLGTDDIARVYGAVQVIQVICRKYEFRDKDERTVLTPVIENAFPRLLQMLQSLIANEAQRNDKTLAALVKLILKTYWSATYLELPPALMRADVFGAWITCLHQMIGMTVPTEGQPAIERSERTFRGGKPRSGACTSPTGCSPGTATRSRPSRSTRSSPRRSRIRYRACSSSHTCSCWATCPGVGTSQTESSTWRSSTSPPRCRTPTRTSS